MRMDSIVSRAARFKKSNLRELLERTNEFLHVSLLIHGFSRFNVWLSVKSPIIKFNLNWLDLRLFGFLATNLCELNRALESTNFRFFSGYPKIFMTQAFYLSLVASNLMPSRRSPCFTSNPLKVDGWIDKNSQWYGSWLIHRLAFVGAKHGICSTEVNSLCCQVSTKLSIEYDFRFNISLPRAESIFELAFSKGAHADFFGKMQSDIQSVYHEWQMSSSWIVVYQTLWSLIQLTLEHKGQRSSI